MNISTFSSREFNQRVAAAKKAANADNLVYILDREKPAHVLMSIDKFRKLLEKKKNILEMLAMPEELEIEFEVDRAQDFPRPVPF